MVQRIKLLLLLVCTIFSLNSYAQSEAAFRPEDYKEGYKKWSKGRKCLRVAIATQKVSSAEIGLGNHKYRYTDSWIISNVYYVALERLGKTPVSGVRNVYGIKIGYEVNASGVAFGLEAKLQSNAVEADIIVMPKVGLGVRSLANVFYGYSISLPGAPIAGLKKHQFSLVINLNRHMVRSLKAS